MVVFAGFSVWYMKVPVTRNYIFAGMLLAGVAYLILVMRVTAKSVHVFSLSCLLT